MNTTKFHNAVKQWIANNADMNRSSLQTDGLTLMSYNLCIGRTTADGRKILLDARGRHFVTMTTSIHVGIATRYKNVEVVEPIGSGEYIGFPSNWDFGLYPVEDAEAEDPSLEFMAVTIGDGYTLPEIYKIVRDDTITAAAYRTDSGAYDPLYVRYGYPSLRRGGQWYEWRRAE